VVEPLDKFVRDTRSPLAKLLGDAPVAHRKVEGFEGAGGRFKGVSLALVALSGDVQERATSDAAKHLVSVGFNREDLYTEIGESLFGYEIKVQLLSRALRDGNDPTRLFAESADELRKTLEADEVAGLFEHLLDYQEERSPISRARSWEEVEALLVAVGKGLAPATSLNSCDSASLRFMLRELAARWVTLMKPPSSGTSPASDFNT
jgi:hypothetical protein